jgi:hypothetical protein
MATLTITLKTRGGREAAFTFSPEQPFDAEQNGFRLRYHHQPGMPASARSTPPAGERLLSVRYSLTTALRNYHEVIVPDTGRTHRPQRQLVDFWGRSWQSRVNNVFMPLFIFTGQDRHTTLAFGAAGKFCEHDFSVTEPKMERALQAWMKRLTLVIQKGSSEYPLPASVAESSADGAVEDLIYYREGNLAESWHHTLRDFAGHLQRMDGQPPRASDEVLEPWWCPWTDWHSDQVNHELTLANARAATELGIRNIIVDDGWFGPGLDSALTTTITMGAWKPDPAKFPDFRATFGELRSLGCRGILWCAPHAVFPTSEAFAQRRRLLIEKEPGVPATTHNGYHPLCFRSPEARAAMANLCLELHQRYDTDGAKYDLFNNVPGATCHSREHSHDTPSMMEGLRLLLAEIDARTRATTPQFITELKQNYGTPWLHAHGSCMRAGDTPYNPEANFHRTAYISAYTPYSINDYQTLAASDGAADGMAMIIAMMAVGIPTYSMDLVNLPAHHRRSLAFYHGWYRRHLRAFHGWRDALAPDLRTWGAEDGDISLRFLVHGENRLELDTSRRTEVLLGSAADRLLLRCREPRALAARLSNPQRQGETHLRVEAGETLALPTAAGDLVVLEPAS